MVFCEWDEEKSRLNEQKHGIGFSKSQLIFDDQDHVMLAARVSGSESRDAIIGLIDGKMWTCIVTQRDSKTRIISCRRAREKEIAIYEQAKKNDG